MKVLRFPLRLQPLSWRQKKTEKINNKTAMLTTLPHVELSGLQLTQEKQCSSRTTLTATYRPGIHCRILCRLRLLSNQLHPLHGSHRPNRHLHRSTLTKILQTSHFPLWMMTERTVLTSWAEELDDTIESVVDNSGHDQDGTDKFKKNVFSPQIHCIWGSTPTVI